MESVEKQNAQIKLEYEQKLEAARQDVSQSTRSEVLSLQESNENLKMLLSTAEKKYTRLADLNNELQKKLDTMEQQKRLQNDQMCGLERRIDCRSISMRNGRLQAAELTNEADDDQTPLLGAVGRGKKR